MHFTEDQLMSLITNFALPYIRISAMLMSMIVVGTRFIPQRIRLFMGLAITVAVMPILPHFDIGDQLFSLRGWILIAQQITIGVALGLATQLIHSTFIVLGQIIGMQSSLGFASMVDPANGQDTPVVGQFYMFLSLLLFLSFNGHLVMFKMIVTSFTTLPIGGDMLRVLDYHALSSWYGLIFKGAYTMALSGVIALLTINISFGIMTRAAPQLNIFALGFAFVLIIGFIINWFVVAEFIRYYQFYWHQGMQQICSLIRIDC